MTLGHSEHGNVLTLYITFVSLHKVEPQCSVWEAVFCGSYPQEPADVCWQSDLSQSCVRSLLPDVLACHDHAPLSLCQEQT